MRRVKDQVMDTSRAGRGFLVGMACVMASLCAPLGTGATQATPDAIAPAASCTIAPLTLPLFGGTPAANLLSTPVAVNVEDLQPVTADVEASVREGASEILACLNTGEPKETYAVFTTDYLARTYGDPETAYLPAFEQSLDEAPASPASQFVIQGFVIDGHLADGRVVVSLTLAGGDEVWADQLVLAQVDGHWLIDDILT